MGRLSFERVVVMPDNRTVYYGDDGGYTMSFMYVADREKDLSAKDGAGNTANVDKIANPDNIVFSEEMRTLFISEDSGMHTNNFAWAYNIDTNKLARIASVPDGGEATGLQMVNNLNGHSYLMLSSQNPGNVGYIDGLPVIDKK